MDLALPTPAWLCALVLALGACADADNPPPQVTSVVPDQVPQGTITPAQVRGQSFYGAARVELGAEDPLDIDRACVVAIDGTALPATSAAFVSPERVDVVIPSDLDLGPHSVGVTSPSGQNGTLPDAFVVVDCSAPTCGDGICCAASGETSCTCWTDCGEKCGDGCCNGTETPSTCPQDCWCGDGVCNGTETAVTCPADCKQQCGDGLCTGTETPSTCPQDCRCGDGVCSAGEDPCTCPQDCGASTCGDRICCAASGETTCSCPTDCGEKCGDGCCNGAETAVTCPADCTRCGDGLCTGTETYSTCPEDCPGCGDGVCGAGEDRCTCPQDCGASTCGDGICCAAGGETTCSCPTDCGEKCGDGCCNGAETSATCILDCPGDIVASADAYVRQQSPFENHGADTDIRAGSGSAFARANRGLVQFDVSSIKCNVVSARLLLYYWDQDIAYEDTVLEVHRVTRPWSEMDVTWNRATNMTFWASPGGGVDFDPAAVATATLRAGAFGWVEWDVTSVVRAWLTGTANNGLVLLEPNDGQGNDGRKIFYSRHSTNVSLRPDLTVQCGP